jgi:ribosomal protein S18 acetylase RimI-like enzyme
MSVFSISSVRPEDVLALQAIARETFYETFAQSNTPENMAMYLDNDFSLEKLEAELSEPESRTFFAGSVDRTIGYLKINVGSAQTDKVKPGGLEIQRIYIKKEYHGTNAGLVLLQHAINLAINEGYHYVWLAVWENNPRAIRFYEKNGFMPFGSHVFQLGNDAQTDILMKKLL